MEVITAKTAGFCFGVERAVNTVYEELASGGGPLYTYGPIIHNEEVVAELEARGVRILDGPEALAELTEKRQNTGEPAGTVVIRSHGVSRAEEEQMRLAGLRVVDATCPFVKKIHRTVAEASEIGQPVIIIGDPEHPEVQGIRGWCSGEAVILTGEEDFDSLSLPKGAKIVVQTTFNPKKFQETVAKLKKADYSISVVNTICGATKARQNEAMSISSQVDTMIVIGGRHSSNTQKLYEICKAGCAGTHFIQTLADLVQQGFRPVGSVGITAGASTPKNIIEEVQTYVRNEF